MTSNPFDAAVAAAMGGTLFVVPTAGRAER